MSETLPVVIQDMIRNLMDKSQSRNYRENLFMRMQEIRDAASFACNEYKNDRDTFFDNKAIRKFDTGSKRK